MCTRQPNRARLVQCAPLILNAGTCNAFVATNLCEVLWFVAINPMSVSRHGNYIDGYVDSCFIVGLFPEHAVKLRCVKHVEVSGIQRNVHHNYVTETRNSNVL